ncbi:hypothetical protein GS429_05545 [Natronorubrum sp. JWXQ-INN-674]|uniref:Uncharacterized protein n=1 Tax=Natronorubrum halalkaliphilum TaxID=2691917 RepID=A0A6B0VKA4_9EURY|nr:hypothetical protein [Natronorubrum halalkaliphilum]MXV61537.1 hypothetical protein [Natronorubrum halalkaliphilum]
MQRWYGVFPNRPPTKSDLVGAVCGVLLVALNASTVDDWRWVAVGVVIGALVMGPLAQSPIGRQIDSMARDLGIGGRILVIAIGGAAVVAFVFLPPISGEIAVDTMIGVALLIPFYVLGHLLVARDLGGWSPD